MKDKPKKVEESADRCSKSRNGKHTPDWESLEVIYDGEKYIDVNCKHCGRSGCLGSEATLRKGICW